MCNMNKNLPVYELLVDDDILGMYALALTNNPAMEVAWVAFSKDEKQIKCSVLDDEQRKVLAVICRADFPFYRRDDSGYEYYAIYHKDTLEKMARMLLKNGFQESINIEHNPDAYIDGVELEQIFVKDIAKGVNPAGFEAIEDGSLFGIYHISNDAIWDAVKNGTFVGVSLEGVFKFQMEKKEDVITNLEQLLEKLK